METLSSNSVSSLMDALKVCDGLEFLSMINQWLTEMSQHIPEQSNVPAEHLKKSPPK